MEPSEYVRMATCESSHWWYRALRAAVVNEMDKLRLTGNARVLDAGCGSGSMVSMLAHRFGFDVCGVDLSEHARRLWNGVSRQKCVNASVGRLPFGDDAFDAVVSLDVLYHRDVDVNASMRELRRVLKVGGGLVMTLPAYDWMHSTHDEAVHTGRRFTKRSVKTLLQDYGFRVDRCVYLFSSVFHWSRGRD